MYGQSRSGFIALGFVALPLALAPLACGDDSGRRGDSGDDIGTLSTSDSGDVGTESVGDDGTTTTTGTTDSGDGAKFDLAPIPDASGCFDNGGIQTEFSYIWIANSTEGTVSKIDTVSTIEEGRFIVTDNPAQQPSRTSVNQFGDMAVGHRFAAKVTKIAAVPERCIDKNNDGVIQTSTGPNDILPYMTDECVHWTVQLPDQPNGTRAVAWEGGILDPVTCVNTVPNPRLWVAYGSNPLQVYRLSGETGEVLDQTTVPSAGYVYGGAVNAEGDFWISDRSGKTLSRVDAETLEVNVWPVPASNAYGVGMDENGHPWIATYAAGPGADFVHRFDPDTQTWSSSGGAGGYYRGMVIDRESRAWVAGNSPCRLALFDAAGEVSLDDAIALPGCVDPVGTSVDRDGYVWIVDRGASLAWKVDPNFKIIVGMVTGLVNPYTYSDMTGQGLNLVINPPG
ncbi:MAG: hypothetical protein KC457_03160 [Myxococcales bacterium]|nr:hypothetical protein [Myxococcales bacterium]